MSSKVGLWIDHRQAFIVYLSRDDVTTKTIPSNMEKHVRASGGSRSSTIYGPQDIVAEDRIYRKYKHHLDQYYEEVARALRGVNLILIMGPGEAKGELKKHLLKPGHSPKAAIMIETTDKMTEPQIIAKVKRHYSD
ncbi:hypothetical protein [Desulfobacter sp.]|uniref:hypothetical protein n=1 Tax=Desulfobacter sp. TaxID=2294 RepID=UPI000E9CA589|nr:hypothetical protein [Desulfobacter sp.]HBT88163.1 hypothetical protein [Desulfobacter sp.]